MFEVCVNLRVSDNFRRYQIVRYIGVSKYRRQVNDFGHKSDKFRDEVELSKSFLLMDAYHKFSELLNFRTTFIVKINIDGV